MKLKNFFKLFFLLFVIFFTKNAYNNENIDNNVKNITLELRCMTCQNQSVHDSDSDFAKDVKKIVKEKLNEGFSEREIKNFLTERYGEYILFKPYINLKNLLLWLFPFALFIISVLFLLKNLKKN
tara:strand:- start:36213 stop:36587 length:375 start_codon:yes stop_codon:yes gene_type:complete